MSDELYSIYLSSSGVETDTRKPLQNKIFFALKGENFDGNEYASVALEQGAKLAMIDDPQYQSADTYLVEDVLDTLQQLALHHRRALGIPIIAITGSNGKTSSKELIHRVMSQKYETTATVGNLNNHIGIPLTLLAIPSTAEYSIVEMGANHVGEIASYCQYTEPDYGLITNIGKAHLEGFGSLEGVRRGKGELYDYLRANDGKVFVYKDLETLMEMSEGIHRETYASQAPADLVGQISEHEGPYLEVEVESTQIRTQMTGDYNLANVLAALCIGQHFGVAMPDMKSAIESYAPDNSRSQIMKKDGNTIILDAYNANPSSMMLAIENLAKIDARPKVAMLGSMKELGESSAREHQSIIERAQSMDIDRVIVVGEEYADLDLGDSLYFLDSTAAGRYLSSILPDADYYILIKGSRATKMEEILKHI